MPASNCSVKINKVVYEPYRILITLKKGTLNKISEIRIISNEFIISRKVKGKLSILISS